jgi:nitroimidazol reductase NimA-like FMN-containing flavoprotein (pyridoxamine 5'-phosphate oxidase superfamily)
VDTPQLVELDEGECWARLERESVGRLAVVLDGQPLVFPVNYAVVDRAIAIGTDPGTKLTGATLRRVAFEIDGIDREHRGGWSVLVQGIGDDSSDEIDEIGEHVRSSGVDPWAGERTHWLRIVPTVVTGRELRPPA